MVHTPRGKELLWNFAHRVCGCSGTWTMRAYVEVAVEQIRAQVGDGQVICALSGGVDSSVAALLVHRAIGDRLHCIFVDNGVLREGERKQVEEVFGRMFHLPLVTVDAADRFLDRLAGVTDPEQKRKIIGREFIDVFEEEASGWPPTGRGPASWRRARSTPTSSSRSPSRARRPPSRATTTWAACPRR